MKVLTGILTTLLLCSAGSANAAIFTVTNTATSGAGSLHQAILDANATVTADEIHFSILALGDLVIGGDLPPITEPLTIDGYTQPGATENTKTNDSTDANLRIVLDGSALGFEEAVLEVNEGPTAIRGLVINNMKTKGSAITVGQGVGSVSIRGCFIGTNSAGTSDESDGDGLVIKGKATVGSSLAADRNLISGNDGAGISMRANQSVVQNNIIGLDADGDDVIPNGTGIELTGAAAIGNRIGGTSIGAGNIIAGNDGTGILVDASAGANNRFEMNRIRDNGALGIDIGGDGVTLNDEGDVDTGPNGLQNFPDLAFARINDQTLRVEGSLESVPAEYRVEFFRNEEADESGFGEGAEYLGFALVTILGGETSAAFAVELPLAAAPTESFFVTATAQNPDTRETSEFSRATEAVLGGDELVVVNTNASGAGSLLAALTAANANDDPNTIVFDIPGAGPHTIQPETELAIDETPVILDGYSQPGSSLNTQWTGSNADLRIVLDGSQSADTTAVLGVFRSTSVVRGLVIHSGTDDGLRLVEAENSRIEGNFIGTNASGTVDLGNTGDGVKTGLSEGSRIGGPAPAQRNLISGNGADGISDSGSGTQIVNNIVGGNATATAALGNDGPGIVVTGSNAGIGGDAPGLGNVILGNDGAGIVVDDLASGVSILGNDVFDNGALGIDLFESGFPNDGVTPNDANDADTDGGNALQNFPEILGVTVLSSSVEVDGLLDVPADRIGTNYRIHVYRNLSCDPSDHGEGELFLGAANVNIPADQEFSVQIPATVDDGDFVTLTATDPVSGNTSEFSECFEIGADQGPLCGDANLDDDVSASDALIVLNVAVGTGTCDLCICDANGNGQVQTSDALLTLKKGVGQPVAMNCPDCE